MTDKPVIDDAMVERSGLQDAPCGANEKWPLCEACKPEAHALIEVDSRGGGCKVCGRPLMAVAAPRQSRNVVVEPAYRPGREFDGSEIERVARAICYSVFPCQYCGIAKKCLAELVELKTTQQWTQAESALQSFSPREPERRNKRAPTVLNGEYYEGADGIARGNRRERDRNDSEGTGVAPPPPSRDTRRDNARPVSARMMVVGLDAYFGPQTGNWSITQLMAIEKAYRAMESQRRKEQGE